MSKFENKYISLQNAQAVEINKIPVLTYSDFYKQTVGLLSLTQNHCVNYFVAEMAGEWQFFMVIANDKKKELHLYSHKLAKSENAELESLTKKIPALHIFEREIFENYGISFPGHPWLKPVRFAHNRANKNQQVNDYPFYSIKSEELHEVGVGPVHAGIIEPGHFRFICNGEEVLHLEIQLGWQHRGVETALLEKPTVLQKTIVAESVAGDTTVAHAVAFARLVESLSGIKTTTQLDVERAIAIELERIAVHTADLSALCTDVAYNLGANVFGILRTGIINYTQSWCGNRLGKGLVRVGGTNFPFTNELRNRLLKVLDNYEKQFIDMAHHTFRLPSVANRFDDIGTISSEQVHQIGAVGMVARMANVNRDIRSSFATPAYQKYFYSPVVLPKGDVFSRFLLRRKEIKASIAWLRNVLNTEDLLQNSRPPVNTIDLKPGVLAVSLTEGWRGEICHVALTNADGNLAHYKVKDPSLHNWKALELSLRNLEISDFPINNKSYNLSYCGFDL